MIEPATHITTPAIESTLEVVRNQFEAVRKRKRRARRILAYGKRRRSSAGILVP